MLNCFGEYGFLLFCGWICGVGQAKQRAQRLRPVQLSNQGGRGRRRTPGCGDSRGEKAARVRTCLTFALHVRPAHKEMAGYSTCFVFQVLEEPVVGHPGGREPSPATYHGRNQISWSSPHACSLYISLYIRARGSVGRRPGWMGRLFYCQ
eukprot:1316988-Alexandrium_andersonii.AAC.1